MTSDLPVGRQAELTTLERFLDAIADGSLSALALTGHAGIGKSTLWLQTVSLARERGFEVLVARPTASETQLSFSGLADLLRDVPDTTLEKLPAVQREALEVALLRSSPRNSSYSARAVATAVLSALSALAESTRLLVAVEDAQWLDTATAEALSFALRRMDEAPIGVLVSVRTERSRPATFEQAVAPERRRDLELGPMSTAAIHDVIERQLGTSFARPVVVQIAAASDGNPLYASEIAREAERTGFPAPGRSIGPPAQLRELMRGRIARLPAQTRDALLIAASLSHPTLELVDSEALSAAEEEGIVTLDADGSIAFSHPLLAAAVYESASTAKRRAMHKSLAERAGDGEERARHLGLAAQGPDELVAGELDLAAEHAAARGATAAACQLGRRALELSVDVRGAQAATRALALARYLLAVGQTLEAKTLLESIAGYPLNGDALAQALLQLGDILWFERDFTGGYERLMEALAVATDPVLIARIHNSAAWISEQIDIKQAIGHEDAVLDLLPPSPGPYSFALFYRTYLRLIDGQGADRDAFNRALALGQPASQVDVSPVPFSWHTWMDEFDTAREVLDDAVVGASALGDEMGVQAFLCQLVSIECWTGNWERANELASRVMQLTDRIESSAYLGSALFARGYVDAHVGNVQEARAAGMRMLGLFADSTQGHLVFGHWLLGFTALVKQDLVEAEGQLSKAAELVDRMGVREPVRMRFQPDLVEVVIGLGDLDRAERLIARLDERAVAFPRPWLLATSARCRGLLSAARGDLDSALAYLESSMKHHANVEMPFERARTLLATGQVLRRRREKREARQLLAQARAEFERLGAKLWLDRADMELARIPTRRTSESLSATEQQIARLAASGLTNREIAERAFVSPKTVEANMARIYRKLDITSRAQLGRAMANIEAAVET